MLIPLLFGCGIVFIFLGLTKQVGLAKTFPEANDAISVLFFVYGFMHLVIALFMLNAPVPYGALEYTNVSDQINTTYIYVNVTANQSVDCNLTCIKEIPILNSSTEIRFHEEAYVYSDSGGGIVNAVFIIDVIILCFYLILLAFSLFKRAIKGKPNEENADNTS